MDIITSLRYLDSRFKELRSGKLGEITVLLVSEDLIEKVPSLAMRNGLSLIDAEEVEGGYVKITVEHRFLNHEED
jgi:hypothetical protein